MRVQRRTWHEVEQQLLAVVREQLGVEPHRVTLDTSLTDDLGADSLTLVELLMAVEESFELEALPESVVEDVDTLAEAISSYVTAYPRETLQNVQVRAVMLRLRSDGTIEAALRVEDGSWTYADGTSVLPSRLCLFTVSKWTGVLAELERIVSDAGSSEQNLQDFLEAYPELIMGDDYEVVVPQAVIAPEGAQTKEAKKAGHWRADFVLAPTRQTEFCKILELKMPRVPIFRQRAGRHLTFSAKLYAAIQQLRDYAEAFNSARTRESFQAAYGLDVYQPDLHLIVGRRWDVECIDSARRLLRSSPVKVDDWDSLLDRLRRRFA